MKRKTAKENMPISKAIEDALGFTLANEEFSLSGWGMVDNWTEYALNTLIFLECEKGQKHPNTNVMKFYPYLEEYPDVRVILIQYFFPENNAPLNRIKLCNFIGAKMEHEFGIRFQYIPLRCDLELFEKEFEKYDSKLMSIVLSNNRAYKDSKSLKSKR